MKVVILAGGFGTRISEESHLKPKPMVEIGGKPIMDFMILSFVQGINSILLKNGLRTIIFITATSRLTFGMMEN